MTRPLSVLFVCTANICRSAFAEVLARHRVGDALDVRSAGTHGWTDHGVEEHMAAELEARGVDPSGFSSRRLTPAIVDAADVVLTAAAAHRTFVLQERPVAMRRTFTLGQFAAALDEVDPEMSGADLLLPAVRRARPTALAEDDVADPYQRGPEAARVAAEQIEAHLTRILPRLLI